MMERNFYTDEFEELIRQKTGQYKMYPSDKVWKGIYSSLHTKRRRFVTGMAILIGGFLIIAGKELLAPSKAIDSLRKMTIADLPKNTEPSDLDLSFSSLKKGSLLQQLSRSSSARIQNKESQIKDQQANSFLALTDPQSNQEALLPPGFPGEFADKNGTNSEGGGIATSANQRLSANSNHPAVENPRADLAISISEHSPILHSVSPTGSEKILKNESDAEREDKKQINWLHEYAVQQLIPLRQHRMNWQVYFSPTVNYRTLSGPDYSPIKPAIPNVPVALIHFGNINNFVDHSPAIGYELGTSLVYRVTRNISFKAGLQFNYSRYYIRAYASNRQPAAITLNSYYGYITDSLTSTIGNFGGKSREDLQNKYYEISAPIGMELRVIGNGRLQLNIAGTLQPSYLLNTNSYLLTNDYTKYIKEPSLFRRWNLNGGLEAFLSYQAAGIRWQIGPEFRYQMYSTYKNTYPVKENLMEYGIKIGLSKIIR
jgi:hypothetical protein